MEFLLNIAVRFPPEMNDETRRRLLDEEHRAAEQLRERGDLVRIWRVPCTSTENWSVWRADDATHLHRIVSGLPLFPWMEITVHPLADHPLESGGAG
jgi:muconolactone D-isomerase